MNWIEKVIGEFGRQIGINDLALNTSGRLQLDADDGFSAITRVNNLHSKTDSTLT